MKVILGSVAAIAIIGGLAALVGSSSKDLVLNYPSSDGSGKRADGLPDRIEIGMEEMEAEAAAANMPKATMITKDGFRPSSITLKMGDNITFYNKTGSRSQIYTKSNRVEIIREIQQDGDSRKIVFPNSGTIEVIDVFNPGIKFTVNVTR